VEQRPSFLEIVGVAGIAQQDGGKEGSREFYVEKEAKRRFPKIEVVNI
jgi:hypothetical protein